MRLRVLIVALALAVGGLVFYDVHDTGPSYPHFCNAALHFNQIGPYVAVLQDQSIAGRDGCDLGDVDHTSPLSYLANRVHEKYMLGYDCKVYDTTGAVVTTTTPNRHDGTCGQPG